MPRNRKGARVKLEKEKIMDEKAVKRFLQCGAGPVVDLAIEMANLTWKEELAVTLCGRKDMTQERAAEKAGYSVDTMQRWYRKALEKLRKSWNGVWWIEKLSE